MSQLLISRMPTKKLHFTIHRYSYAYEKNCILSFMPTKKSHFILKKRDFESIKKEKVKEVDSSRFGKGHISQIFFDT